MEWRLFDEGTTPFVSTWEFHKDREAVAHIDQVDHQARLAAAKELVEYAAYSYSRCTPPIRPTLSDLGCGEGGFLNSLKDLPITTWGYDFQEANIIQAKQKYDIDVRNVNFLIDNIEYGQIVVCLECIEHLADPHGFIKRLHDLREKPILICSSPMNETDSWYSPEHAWAWDVEGYTTMIKDAGYFIGRSIEVWPFQVHACFPYGAGLVE